MITATSLTKSYGETTVLNIEQLEIPKGQCFGLVGNNGAGKTTFFSILLDLIKTSTGEIISNDIAVAQSEEWKTFTSAFIDDSFLIGYLTPEEYFHFVGELRGIDKAAVDLFLETYVDFFNDEILNQKKYLRDFSKGNQKKVGLIATFIGNPKVVILDEPFA
ncbi:ATP-binding cassette domain-containing protein, partial [bacterium]|nr:ATP-binding cassette domain-containing protein [bacterium]